MGKKLEKNALIFKRQRSATEALHIMARQKNVKIETDAIGVPMRVVYQDQNGELSEIAYVIVSKDKTKVFSFDMISGIVRSYNSEYVRLTEFKTTELLNRKLKAVHEFGIDPEDSKNKRNFRFVSWAVLELLKNGHFFYRQNEMTAAFEAYCAANNLVVKENSNKKFRAKILNFNGKPYWSYVVQDEGKKTYFLLSPEKKDIKDDVVILKDNNNGTVTGSDGEIYPMPRLWVLHQRNAIGKIHSYLHTHADVCAGPESHVILALMDSVPVWAQFVKVDNEEKFLVVPITGEDPRIEDYGKVKSIGMADRTVVSVGGYEFSVRNWIEAEFDDKRSDDDE